MNNMKFTTVLSLNTLQAILVVIVTPGAVWKNIFDRILKITKFTLLLMFRSKNKSSRYRCNE